MAESLSQKVSKFIVLPVGKALDSSKAKPEKLWISTQEAANRCGFSRPFVAALLDSGTYQGKVLRTAGGHSKVLASEFEALVAKASVTAPKTLAQTSLWT